MIGNKYAGMILVSVAGLSAALSDQPLSLSKVATQKQPAPSVEQRVVADARKRIDAVRAHSSSLERVVCEYRNSEVSVRAHYTGYHQKSELLKSEHFSVDGGNTAKVVVTHLSHDPEKLCLTTYSSNGDRLDSKEIPCNNI